MKVLLSSNVTHYQYAAEALNNIGILDSYHTTIAPINNDLRYFNLLPRTYREKFRARNIENVPQYKIIRHIFPELFQIFLKKLPTNYFNLVSDAPNNWFDYFVSREISNIDVFHFVSGIGVISSAKAKMNNILTVCDERMEHPEYQHTILEREHVKWNVPYRYDINFYYKTAIEAYKNSNYLIVGSNYTKQTYIDRGFNQDQVFVIPYGYDSNIFYPPNKFIEDEKLKIIYVGQLIPRKGFFYLIEALKSFAKNKLIQVSFVGDDPYNLYKKYIDEFNLNKVCRYFGSVSKVHLAQMLRESSVCFMPSLADSQPLSCLEAIGCHCPVVVTEKMGTAELVKNGYDGIIVRAGNSGDLAEIISELLLNRNYLENLRFNLKSTANNLTWSSYKAKLQSFYTENIQ